MCGNCLQDKKEIMCYLVDSGTEKDATESIWEVLKEAI